MWIRSSLAALFLLSGLLAAMSGDIGQNIGGGIGDFDRGVSGHGGGKPLAACGTGVIDLSTGCTLGIIP